MIESSCKEVKTKNSFTGFPSPSTDSRQLFLFIYFSPYLVLQCCRGNLIVVNNTKTILTSDLNLDDAGGGVPLEVAGVAAVVPRLVPGDALEDETVAADEDSPADVLHHGLVLIIKVNHCQIKGRPVLPTLCFQPIL